MVFLRLEDWQVGIFEETNKNIIKKTILSGSDLYLCLSYFRNTPISYNPLSPSQWMFVRILRSNIPVYDKILKSKIQNYRNVTAELRNRKLKQKFYYDKGSRNLSELNKEDIVKIKNFGKCMKWIEGNVMEKIGFRRYSVKTVKGNILIRNRKFLVKVNSDVSQGFSKLNNRMKNKRFRYDNIYYEIDDDTDESEIVQNTDTDNDDDVIIIEQEQVV